MSSSGRWAERTLTTGRDASAAARPTGWGKPMSHRHDPVRVSRRAALGAAAAAGAALGSGTHAIAAPDPPSPDGPANNPYFVNAGNDVPEIAPAPTTPGTRYVSLAGSDFKPISDIAIVLVALGLRAQLRDGEHVHDARPAPARCAHHRDGHLRDASRQRQHRGAPGVPPVVRGGHQRRLQRRVTRHHFVHTVLGRPAAVRRGIALDDRSRRR